MFDVSVIYFAVCVGGISVFGPRAQLPDVDLSPGWLLASNLRQVLFFLTLFFLAPVFYPRSPFCLFSVVFLARRTVTMGNQSLRVLF